MCGLQMNSSFVATKFYNRPLDSGFVYYNSRNVLLNHIILIKNFNISGAFTESFTNDYHLYTISGGVQWKVKKWLSLGSSVKYNRQSIAEVPQIGYGFNGAFVIPKIGNVQMRIQKSYVPGPEAKLVPDNIGRLTYSRNF